MRFNNKVGILTEQDTHELFLTSKKNGNNQSWPEFSGQITTSTSSNKKGIGSIMMVNTIRDMDIADMLSSGSSGMYQFRVTAEFENAEFTDADGVVNQNPYLG